MRIQMADQQQTGQPKLGGKKSVSDTTINNQPLNAGVVSPQVQKGTVGLNQHFSLHRVSLS
jgi:hypothetical protein